MSESGLHNKYRPRTFERLIGNDRAVSELRGIINKGKYPSGLLFSGPAGVGKTTLARAFVNEVNGEGTFAANCQEMNFGDERSIEDIRKMIQISRLRPAAGAKRRFVLGDEVHQLLSNKPAANAFLKPLEEPVSTTTMLLCTMEPANFQGSETGRAMLSRCNHIALKLPTPDELRKQAKRIIKGEDMSAYMGEEVLDKLADLPQISMRILANTIESMGNFYEGLPKKRKLTAEDVIETVQGGSSSDDVIAARFLLAVYARKYVAAHREILDVSDGFGFVNKCLFMNWFLLSTTVLKGARHPKVWGNTHAWTLLKESKAVLGELDREIQMTILGEVHTGLTNLKLGSGAFAVDERLGLANTTWMTVQRLKQLTKG